LAVKSSIDDEANPVPRRRSLLFACNRFRVIHFPRKPVTIGGFISSGPFALRGARIFLTRIVLAGPPGTWLIRAVRFSKGQQSCLSP
jgi:hypothetical protein